MRNWFAAFAPDQNAVMPETWVTRVTRVTATRKARKSADSGWRHTEDGKGNKRATRVTEAGTDPHAGHSVTPVTQVLPNQKQSSKGARSPEIRGLEPAVTHVTHVAHNFDAVRAATPNSAWAAEDWRTFYDERAGIAEFDGDQTRAEAEARAFQCCVTEWLNQHPEPSDPGCCAWCGAEETSEARVVPCGTIPAGHTWLHPECWQEWAENRRASAITALTDHGIDITGSTEEPAWNRSAPSSDGISPHRRETRLP